MCGLRAETGRIGKAHEFVVQDFLSRVFCDRNKLRNRVPAWSSVDPFDFAHRNIHRNIPNDSTNHNYHN